MAENEKNLDLSILKTKDKSALVKFLAKLETSNVVYQNAEYSVMLEDFYAELGDLKKNQLKEWHMIYPKLLKDNKKNDTMISIAINKSLTTANRLRHTYLPDREDVLAIAACLPNNNLQETNRLLNLAGYSTLYPKTISDCVWYYVLEFGSHTTPAQSHEEYMKIISEKVQQYLSGRESFVPMSADEEKTKTTNIELMLLESLQDKDHDFADSAFMQFILDNLHVLCNPYLRLIKRIDEEIGVKNNKKGKAANSRFSAYQPFLDRYYREIQYMKSGRAPDRDFLLALGIHKKKSKDDFNAFLLDANQSPLSPFDIRELAILFVLNHLDVFYPTLHSPGCGLHDDPDVVAQVLQLGYVGFFLSFFNEMEKNAAFKKDVVKFSKLISLITPAD